ncbi:HNH endonuclease [Collimonas sp. OK607]|uniref:HNH endonuclease n=1 Tax=Collimonas sp. OK607 TaxID=1798194 RepID=UPI0008EE8D97|nr:HNH endonuclease [Collimonas sp. OK607]SFB35872.1 HNH endonuclease [Collimonas sp. OK607]
MSAIQHDLAHSLLKIIHDMNKSDPLLTYQTAAKALGRPTNNARAIAQVCDLLDAAAALANVPLLALVAVRTVSGEINPKAWVKVKDAPGDIRERIIKTSLSHIFTNSDFTAIEMALTRLNGYSNRTAWAEVRKRIPARRLFQQLSTPHSIQPQDKSNDLGSAGAAGDEKRRHVGGESTMSIASYRTDLRFAACPQAILVTGKAANDSFNRKLLEKNQTGHWVIASGRVRNGDLVFLLLPDEKGRGGYPRELHAGVVTGFRLTHNKTRTLLTVQEFFPLCDIEQGIKGFLGGKLPPQGDHAMEVWQSSPDSASTYGKAFEEAVKSSLRDDTAARKKRLLNARRIPTKVTVTTKVFLRNPDVVAEVLFQAKGVCGRCKKSAPFNRKSDGRPYLEVHHKKRLADHGEDTVENAIALCPNCHRKSHFG